MTSTNKTNSKVRVRFAPSPTGYLHVGGARTALFNYLYAKKHGGDFVLRVEDTDLERSTDESLTMQIQDLQWLGLEWTEGLRPENLESEGSYGPYRQSQRLSIYQEKAVELINTGKAYYCFMTDEEVEAQKQNLKTGQHLVSPFREAQQHEVDQRFKQGEKAVIRFKNHEASVDYKMQDLIRGEIAFSSEVVGDFVLMRSNGMPVYNFCCAIDDALMEISHVFRAEEHLPNTLRQMMIYEALGFTTPQFGHFSLILGEDKQKLSKRHGATSVNEYKNKGYLPEALNNYLALLGWNPGDDREIFQVAELIDLFTLDRVNSSPAVFDETKLKWINATHLRALSDDELWKRLAPTFEEKNLSFKEDMGWRGKALELLKPRMETLEDAVDLFTPLANGSFKLFPESEEALGWESTRALVEAYIESLEVLNEEYLSVDQFSEIQSAVKKKASVKGKQLFMPLRVCVIGKPHGADLQLLVPLLEREELVSRAKKVLEKL